MAFNFAAHPLIKITLKGQMFNVRLLKDKTNPGIAVDTYKRSTPEAEAIASQI